MRIIPGSALSASGESDDRGDTRASNFDPRTLSRPKKHRGNKEASPPKRKGKVDSITQKTWDPSLRPKKSALKSSTVLSLVLTCELTYQIRACVLVIVCVAPWPCLYMSLLHTRFVCYCTSCEVALDIECHQADVVWYFPVQFTHDLIGALSDRN